MLHVNSQVRDTHTHIRNTHVPSLFGVFSGVCGVKARPRRRARDPITARILTCWQANIIIITIPMYLSTGIDVFRQCCDGGGIIQSVKC